MLIDRTGGSWGEARGAGDLFFAESAKKQMIRGSIARQTPTAVDAIHDGE